jgi:hypothetical protein
MLGLVAVIGLAVAAPALGQTVVDGDTNKLNGTTYRIWSIDAAERKLICAEGWWLGKRHRRRCSRCSPAARSPANRGSRTGRARCGPVPSRRPRRCRCDGQRRHGVAFARYSSDYVSQERAAIGGATRGPRARVPEAVGLAGKNGAER